MGLQRLYATGTGSAAPARTVVADQASAPGSRGSGACEASCLRFGSVRPAPPGAFLHPLTAAMESPSFLVALPVGLPRCGSWAWKSGGVKVTPSSLLVGHGVACGVGGAQNVTQPSLKLGLVLFNEVRLSVSSMPIVTHCRSPKVASFKREIAELG